VIKQCQKFITLAIIACFFSAVFLPISLYASTPAHAEKSTDAVTEIFNLQLSSGDYQRILFASPYDPKGTIIMLPGGAGEIGISNDGDMLHADNFLIRTRVQWIEKGYAVLIPDAVNNTNLRGLRSSPHYAALISELVDFAHTKAKGSIFLLGTSQGSIAAMNGAAHVSKGQLAGVVLTESVSVLGGSHETVFDASPDLVRIPALIVANHDDRCNVAPSQMAPRIASSLLNSPQVQVLYVSGGINHSNKTCGSLTPHGYYGIESKVISNIVSWMDEHR